jgi:hypothetical protein
VLPSDVLGKGEGQWVHCHLVPGARGVVLRLILVVIFSAIQITFVRKVNLSPLGRLRRFSVEFLVAKRSHVQS